MNERSLQLTLLITLMLPGATASAQTGNKVGILADVDGVAITNEEVEKPISAQLSKLQEQIYNLKRQHLDTLIAERLLANEAARRGITLGALLDAEVNSKVTIVTEAEIDAYIQTNKSALEGGAGPEQRQAIREQLQRQKISARGASFLKSLRDTAKVTVHLAAPPIFRTEVTAGVLPIRGRADAPVTIVEFSDFHCPFCQRAEPTVQQILAKYPTQVRLAYRDIPLDKLHPQARRAAEAARCANDQGKFWEFHDKIYVGPADASAATLRSLAEQSSLDIPRFEQCVANDTHKADVQADAEYAGSLGVNGTPIFFVNGRRFVGALPYETFVQVIEEELARKHDGASGTRH